MSLHGSRTYATLAAATVVLIAAFAGASVASATPLSWSEPVQVDTHGAITDLSCPTTTFCAGVDSARNLLTSDPAAATWPVTGTDSATPRSVSCGTATFCAVVDSGWRAMSYTNGTWGPRVAPSAGSATSINSVSCASATFCLTGSGYTTTPRTIDGGATWEIQNNQGVNYPGAINAVSCAPGGDATTGFCVVVDTSNAAFVSTNGGVTFSPPHRPDGVIAGASGLTAVSCTSSTACVAVDSAGRAFYYRGGVLGGADWTAVDADLGRQLRAVSCVPGAPANQTFCAAVDSGGYQIESSDGGATWTTPALITGTTGSPPLHAVSCPTETFCVATDNGGNAYTAAPLAAPTNTGGAPTVDGGPPQVGQASALSCSDTGVTWTGPSPAIGYRWQTSVPASGTWTDIAGASAQTYAPVAADVGNLLRCVVTATNAGGATDADSAATAAVLPAPVPPTPIVDPPAPVFDPPPANAPEPPPAPPAPCMKFTSKLSPARATVVRSDSVLDVLAPISKRASGVIDVEFEAGGTKTRFTHRVRPGDGVIRFRHELSAAQAEPGTGMVTLVYPGDADTRPKAIRLRAAPRAADLEASRPELAGQRLQAEGTVTGRARGLVRVQLEYLTPACATVTIERQARIGADGRWRLDESLSDAERAGLAARRGAVQSYMLFTGYLPKRIRGEVTSSQVLGSP